jgi:hypothetical protein
VPVAKRSPRERRRGAAHRKKSGLEMNLPSLEADLDPDTDVGEGPPSSPPSRPRTVPPPLPQSARHVAADRVAADDAFAERMLARLAAGDYQGALLAAEALLEYRPLDPDASDTAEIARSELRRVYAERLGSLDAVPRRAMPLEGLLSLQSLDPRAGFLLARIDGVATIREIVGAAGMHATDALRILSELVLRRAIALDSDD